MFELIKTHLVKKRPHGVINTRRNLLNLDESQASNYQVCKWLIPQLWNGLSNEEKSIEKTLENSKTLSRRSTLTSTPPIQSALRGPALSASSQDTLKINNDEEEQNIVINSIKCNTLNLKQIISKFFFTVIPNFYFHFNHENQILFLTKKLIVTTPPK